VKAIVYRDEYLRLVDAEKAEREEEAEYLARRLGIVVRRYG
jgi:hypothetical protein